MSIDYARYLQAKRSIDDRALNKDVFEEFCTALNDVQEKSRLRIVDIGAGTGAMLHRLLDRSDLFAGYSAVEYTMVDVKADVLHLARKLLYDTSTEILSSTTRSPTLNDSSSVHHLGLVAQSQNPEDVIIPGSPVVTVQFRQADALSFLLKHSGSFDAVIAAAFLDLISLDITVPIIRKSMDSCSKLCAFYFPITFDSTTILSPLTHDEKPIHANIMQNFHESMGYGVVSGRKVSRACSGRHLSEAVVNAGGIVRSEGKSVWNITPSSGAYPADERYFLECILSFIESTVSDSFQDKIIYKKLAGDFLKARRKQVENAHLCYEAHNFDVCGVFPL